MTRIELLESLASKRLALIWSPQFNKESKLISNHLYEYLMNVLDDAMFFLQYGEEALESSEVLNNGGGRERRISKEEADEIRRLIDKGER